MALFGESRNRPVSYTHLDVYKRQGICFTGCEDDVVINTGNSDKLDTVDGVYGYVKSAAA